MLGATNMAQFDFFLEWAAKNISIPMVQSRCGGK
jgi:hypothetical protein